ncbi:MAG: protein kinase [Deltaproteobacteria bacterium]|nr:protein kinase [Deltaproteobacteria bacterium]
MGRLRVELHVIRGPEAGRVHVCTEHDAFVFGRSREAHFTLADDPFVSRNHFLIEVKPPQCRLRDLGSKNGTVVNGVAHGGRGGSGPAVVELRDGDRVSVGRTELRISVVPDADGAAGVADPADPTAPVAAPPPTPTPDPDLAGGPRLPPGLVVPGYRLERFLGQGQMGAVYRARQESTGSAAAIKLLAAGAESNPRALALFRREGRVLLELRHPNIVGCHELGEAGGLLFLAMELVEGGDLAGVMEAAGGRLPLAAAASLMLQILDGVGHAHAAGVVHRDLKPANVLVESHGGQAKVSDFGLAKCYLGAGLSRMTVTGDLGGTPAYMPPDQILNYRGCGPVADLYAVGATFYHLLSGEYPKRFPPGREPLLVILQDAPVPLAARCPELPAALCEVVDRCLAHAPGERYQSAPELRRALEATL